MSPYVQISIPTVSHDVTCDDRELGRIVVVAAAAVVSGMGVGGGAQRPVVAAVANGAGAPGAGAHRHRLPLPVRRPQGDETLPNGSGVEAHASLPRHCSSRRSFHRP